jgi:hypothetical protein
MRGIEPEAAVAMPCKDVLDDRGRFSQQQVTVLDQRCGAERMQGRKLNRSGRTCPGFGFSRNAEFRRDSAPTS